MEVSYYNAVNYSVQTCSQNTTGLTEQEQQCKEIYAAELAKAGGSDAASLSGGSYVKLSYLPKPGKIQVSSLSHAFWQGKFARRVLQNMKSDQSMLAL